LTPHPAESYPGLFVFRPGSWGMSLLALEPGQSFVAAGGEVVYRYETTSGVRADGFELRAGERATLVRADLPGFLAEWRIESAATDPEP
jgi:hypothetical protein